MARYALFGDSYISRLRSFTNGKLRFSQPHSFFGVPGMTTSKKIKEMFEHLMDYRPRYVFINLGGNDINDSCSPHEIYISLINIEEEMYKSGVERVFVGSIIERGKFPIWTGINRRSFDKVRKSVNRKLKQYFGRDFVQIGKRLKFPRHYDNDMVHPGTRQGGMKVFEHEVIKAFKSTL